METLPLTARIPLADARGNNRPRSCTVMKALDPEFAARVDWMLGKTMTKPNGPHPHWQFVDVASCELPASYGTFTSCAPFGHGRPSTETCSGGAPNRTVVYYTRNSVNTGHGRAMDLVQEKTMIQMLQETLEKYDRPEKLVIFDGSQHTFQEQIRLSQSANVVIGEHGGRMANLLALLPSTTTNQITSCDERPKVLIFLSNASTPKVQRGSSGKTYYNVYSTHPWAEYHHVL
jgi:hypothetical protein